MGGRRPEPPRGSWEKDGRKQSGAEMADFILRWSAGWGVPSAVQAALLRDIVGDPFRPVSFTPSWRVPAAVALARYAYESHDFSGLGALADALEEAGCTDADVLGHLRADGGPCPEKYGTGWHRSPEYVSDRWACSTCGGTGRLNALHARGCAVLDLILGKS